MALLIVLFIAMGLLLAALAIPLIRRRVKPNRLHGLWVPATIADEWVWYEANARSGRDLLILALVQVAIAQLLPSLLVSIRKCTFSSMPAFCRPAPWLRASLASSVPVDF
jgi:hypothetical protein